MAQSSHKLALTGLQYSLGLVLIYECSRLIFFSGAKHAAQQSHVPHLIILIIAVVELLGAILFLIPLAVLVGAVFCS